MSVFKPIKCASSQLSSIAVVDGQLIFTTDTNEVYLDDNGFRQKYGSNIDSSKVFYWDGKSSDVNSDNIELWQKALDNKPSIIVCTDINNNALFLIDYMPITGPYSYRSSLPYYSRGTTAYGYRHSLRHYEVSIGISSKKVTSVSGMSVATDQDIYYLTTHADTYGSFTPTNDMHPTTKKYVDDKIQTAIGNALGGSY